MMPEDDPSDVLTIDYDRTSRHRLLADVVAELCPARATILDIGGNEGLTAAFLPDARIVTLDIEGSDVEVRASAAALPFRDATFDAVVGLDLLEHVPSDARPAVVAESARVSRELVVFAGPYEDPGVAETEHRVQERFEALFEMSNRWLAEHAQFGRPDFEACREQLQDLGLRVSSFGSNPLDVWEALQSANFLAARLGLADRHGELNRQLFHELLGVADAVVPSYRRFLVACRSGSVPAAARDGRAQDAGVAQAWIQRLAVHQAALVNESMQRLARYNAELREGWEETVRQAAELRAAMDAAREQWAIREQELEEGWRTAARRFQSTQLTMDAYELALFQDERHWRDGVRGPARADAEPASSGADPDEYGAWIDAWAGHVDPPPEAGVTFSVLTPVFNPDSRFLEACIRSVRAQTYSEWQLVLVNASTAPYVAPICRRFALLDDRVTVVTTTNQGIAANTQLAAGRASGDWLLLLDHDDELAPHALAAIAAAIADAPDADLVYADEDKLDSSGARVDPFFKPDWSPDLLRMVNYIGHPVAVRRTLFDAAGGLRAGFDGSQDYDLLLRATRLARRVLHIPDVLYHWRRHGSSTAGDVRVKPATHAAGRRALQDFADEAVPGAWVDLGSGPTTHRLRYPLRRQKVSVVIPFRDTPEVTDACLQSIGGHVNALPFEVLLVSNRSVEEKTLALMETWERQYAWARCLEYDHPFNFHGLNNWAAARSEGDLLLFLNNDTEVLHDGWLDGLAEHAQRPEIGVVGPRLFYPDGRVQHAGVAVGIGGFADHPWRGLHPDDWTAAGPSYWIRNFLSVTAACMMIERTKFDEVGGFDERFTVCGGDVQLGLRLYEAGSWNLMTPFVRLVHHESVTRDVDPPEGDVGQSLQAYATYFDQGDPFYNRNLTRADTSCRIALP